MTRPDTASSPAELTRELEELRSRLHASIAEGARFRELIEGMAQGVVVQARDGSIILSNAAAQKTLGRPGSDLSGRDSEDPVWRAIHEDGSPFPGTDHPAMVALATGKPVRDTLMGVFNPVDDDYRWLRVSAIPRFEEHAERPFEVFVTFDDVTDLRRAVEAQRVSEEGFASTVRSSPMGIHMYRLQDDGRLVFVGANPSADRILGVDHAQFVGKTIEEAFPPLADTEIPDVYRRLAREGGQWHTESISYEDEQIAGAFEVHAFRTTPGHMATLFLDILERKRTERDLRLSQQRLELVLEASAVGTWHVDVPEDRLVVDTRWAALGGYTPEEVGASTRGGFALIHPDDAENAAECFHRHLAGETDVFEAEHRIRAKSGEWVWVLSRGRVVDRNNEGRPTRMAGTCMDISARKASEAERASLQAQVQEAQKLESLGVLAGGIAHDFNNLLCGIIGSADLVLEDMRAGHAEADDLIQIKQTALRAAELCRQLLAYSGKGRFVVEPLDVSELVEGVSRLLSVSIGKKAVLRYELQRDLPAVEADATQLRQIVLNLVVNASEAIGDQSGTITLATGAIDCDLGYLKGAYIDDDLPDGSYVYLEVADTGCGMTEDVRHRIFDPFFTTKFAGRGLGLAATLGIVRGHSGTVKVYSEPGKGTTIKILLPASTRLPVHAAPGPDSGAWRGTGTVLFVDDEETVRTVGARMLRQIGFEVLCAADGSEAVELFRCRQDICLVVLDMTMPKMGGEETFRELRRIRRDVRVILTSGYNEQEATSRFAGKGLAGFMQKPFQLAHLRSLVRVALEYGSAGRSGG